MTGSAGSPPKHRTGESTTASERPARKVEKKHDLSGARVLVAGATGFLGGYISAVLSALGADVIPLAKSRGYDLRNEAEAFQAVMVAHPDMIVDAAGPSGGIALQASKPAATFRDAMQIGMNLTHVAAVARLRLITLGTAGSYPGEVGAGAFRESSFWNGYPHALVASHGIARKAMLAMMQAYKAQFGFRFVYLVPSSVYGPNDHFEGLRASVLPAMVRRFADAVEDQAEEVVCWGTPDVARSFLYAPDLAKAVALACASELDYPDPINLPGAPEITIGTLAQMVAKETGFTGKISWDETKPTGARRRILDGKLAKKVLGWEPETPLQVGLKATVKWYREEAQYPRSREKD